MPFRRESGTALGWRPKAVSAGRPQGHTIVALTERDYGLGKFIQLLVSRRFPDWLRYGGAVVMVGAFVALRLALPLSGTSVVLFIPPILGASLAFGRGPGPAGDRAWPGSPPCCC